MFDSLCDFLVFVLFSIYGTLLSKNDHAGRTFGQGNIQIYFKEQGSIS